MEWLVGRWLAGLAVMAGLMGPAVAQQAAAPPPEPVPACVMPEARSLLPEGGEFKDLVTRVLPMGVGQGRILYVGTSWVPSDGRMFAVSCDGKSLEEEMVGYIRRMDVGPLIPKMPRPLLLVATTFNQPNSREDTFKLIWFRNGKFETLLEHAALSRATGKDAFEEAWTWKIDGARVEFGGTRTTPAVGGRPAKREALPKEAYCWGGTEFAKCD